MAIHNITSVGGNGAEVYVVSGKLRNAANPDTGELVDSEVRIALAAPSDLLMITSVDDVSSGKMKIVMNQGTGDFSNSGMEKAERIITTLATQKNDFVNINTFTEKFGGCDKDIRNWFQSEKGIIFLGQWEKRNNPDFKVGMYEYYRMGAGSEEFWMTPNYWVKSTNAKGVRAKEWKGGKVFIHKEIALEFAKCLCPELPSLILSYVMGTEEATKKTNTNIEIHPN